MIKVLYGDATPLLENKAFSFFIEGIDIAAKGRILDPGRKDRRACRLMSYLMLNALHKREFSSPLPPLLISELGKPYLENGPAISISHDKMMVVVGMTADYKQLGIDLQSEPNPVMASRVRRRFLTPTPPYRKGDPEVEFLMAHIEGGALDITPAHAFGTPSTFLSDYVRAEAIMKMTGGGFADFPNLFALCAACETALIPLEEKGGGFAIGLAYR